MVSISEDNQLESLQDALAAWLEANNCLTEGMAELREEVKLLEQEIAELLAAQDLSTEK